MVQSFRPVSVAKWCLACAVLAGSGQAQLIGLRAELDGSQAVPPNGSPATGTAWGVLDRQANTVSFDLEFSNFGGPNFDAHIHGFAPPGSNGQVRHSLPPNQKSNGVWLYNANQEASILDGLSYFQVNTSDFANGEIRGQIYLDDSAFLLKASLRGSQVVPPANSPARGVAYFRVDVEANSIEYRMDIADLLGSETEARIHGFAPPGSEAPTLVTLPLGNNKTGVWNYQQSDEADIVAGLSYVEISTSGFPGGELRGQIETGGSNPTFYCTAKPNSCGSLPQIAFLGLPSASQTTGFRVGCFATRGEKSGLLLYSNAEPLPIPFQGGTLCIGAPLRRTPPNTDTNGSSALCNGILSIDMNEFASGNGGGTPAPFLSIPGELISVQWWGRDKPQTGALLSDALTYIVRP